MGRRKLTADSKQLCLTSAMKLTRSSGNKDSKITNGGSPSKLAKSPKKSQQKVLNGVAAKTSAKKKRGRPPKSQTTAVSPSLRKFLQSGKNVSAKGKINDTGLSNNNNNNNESAEKLKQLMNNNVDVGSTSPKFEKISNSVDDLTVLQGYNPLNVVIIKNETVDKPENEKKDERIQCKVCSEWFPNRYYQRKHRLREHEDQVYECRICSFNSVDPEKLKSHLVKVHIAKKEKEQLNDTQASIQAGINDMLENISDMIDRKVPRKVVLEDGVSLGREMMTKMPCVCDLCGRVYTCRYSLERHMRCHTLERPFKCTVCDFTSSYQEHINRHMVNVHLIVHSNEPKIKYSEFKKLSNLNSPVKDADPNKPKTRRKLIRQRFECAVCGIKSTHKRVLVQHIRTKHPNAHIQSLDNNDGSKVHLIVTAPKQNKLKKRLTIKCTHCSLIFHDNWKYKVHMRSHTGVKPFMCSVCFMKATSKMTIRDHVHRKHKDVPDAKIVLRTVSLDGNEEVLELPVPWREFICNVCKKQFEDNYQLKQHRYSDHPDTVPFSCDVCDYKSLSKGPLVLHCAQEHPKRKMESLIKKNGQFVKIGPVNLPTCDICQKVFGYRSQLNNHEKIHTGEKSLHCEHCHYKTNFKKELENHIKKIHLGIKKIRKTSVGIKKVREPSVGIKKVSETSVGNGKVRETSVGVKKVTETSVGIKKVREPSVGVKKVSETSAGNGKVRETSVGIKKVSETSVGNGKVRERSVGIKKVRENSTKSNVKKVKKIKTVLDYMLEQNM